MRDALESFRHASLARRIGTLLLITWVPMFVLAIAQGNAIASPPQGSFLADFVTYARFFVAAPVLLVADATIVPRMTATARRFTSAGLVRPADQFRFARAVERLTSRQRSVLATAVLVPLAIVGGWYLTLEHIRGLDMASWKSVGDGQPLWHSLAGLWNRAIAMPIFLFLVYRWVWRLIVWTLFLVSVSRLDLQLTPTHADRAGGLDFLQGMQSAFGMLAFSLSSVLSAQMAVRILYEGARLTSFEGPMIAVLVAVELIFLGPLLVFTPAMTRAKSNGLLVYGELAARYDRAFEHKWIDGAAVATPLLGSADIQSLADMGNSFELVRRMRIAPFGQAAVIKLLLATALPGLPLLLLAVPLNQIFRDLTKMLF